MADVDHLLDSLTSKQISEWVAFYSLEPFGNEWRQAGVVAATIAEAFRDSKQRRKPFTPEDFIPSGKDTSVKNSTQLLGIARMITSGNINK